MTLFSSDKGRGETSRDDSLKSGQQIRLSVRPKRVNCIPAATFPMIASGYPCAITAWRFLHHSTVCAAAKTRSLPSVHTQSAWRRRPQKRYAPNAPRYGTHAVTRGANRLHIFPTPCGHSKKTNANQQLTRIFYGKMFQNVVGTHVAFIHRNKLHGAGHDLPIQLPNHLERENDDFCNTTIQRSYRIQRRSCGPGPSLTRRSDHPRWTNLRR